MEDVSNAATAVPADAESSSVPFKLTVDALTIVGASLTAVIAIEATSVAVLNAVVVPFADTSTLEPNVPLV